MNEGNLNTFSTLSLRRCVEEIGGRLVFFLIPGFLKRCCFGLGHFELMTSLPYMASVLFL